MSKTATILVLIDIQNGFARADLSEQQGGSLYVPGGEEAGRPAADLIRRSSDSIVVLSQDFHPSDHISFAANHAQIKPFSDIYLRCGNNGRYRVVGAGIGGKVMDVDTDAHGHISAISQEELPAAAWEGALKQTLWLRHCVQGTESALFVDPIMAELPPGVVGQLKAAGVQPVLSGNDARGNQFHIVRKGMRSDLDSYGIATENDGLSKTGAPALFERIAAQLQADGIGKAVIGIGGLATNFCVEFSHADLYRELVPALQARGVVSDVQILTDISRGIPVVTPEKNWPDLGAALDRMASLGSRPSATEDFPGAISRK
jgi:nicotinamidase-related amidase